MLIDRNTFQKQFEEETLKIAFIGMSNIGKSIRTEQFRQIKM